MYGPHMSASLGEGSKVNEFKQVHVIGECHNAILVFTLGIPNRQTDTTENITSAQTTYAGVNEVELW